MTDFAGVTFTELIAEPNGRLEDALTNGKAPVADELAGREFRGYNPPAFARWLGFQKFTKGFLFDEAGQLYGYNLFDAAPRSGPLNPWEPKNGGGADQRHGFYDVEATTGQKRYHRYTDASLLNYGSGRNHVLNPESRIRDYLVQVDPDNPALLLGKAYLDFGLFAIFSNFFILERVPD